MPVTYRGFSTVSSDAQKKFVLTDNKLIRQDLLNALNIRLGSLVMQPTVGCIVWNVLFENITPSLIEDISTNITGIVNNDPRLNLQSLDITSLDNSITITMKLLFVLTNEVDIMTVTFNSQNSSASYY